MIQAFKEGDLNRAGEMVFENNPCHWCVLSYAIMRNSVKATA
jgi:hypothetical protein